ncbi:uncharacterized protein LOC121598764 [Anopheles merus]|uniref:uncharacterized protein LOC121598764 n=1 Tax=Anopheles merus TaxID=30066 RepID=UPI001BE418BB|nr:uncharacterized protein LOC121598764 [Anopheles merus]
MDCVWSMCYTDNHEILLTTMTEIEMMVNSRPLTYIPLDEDLDFPITPNHLLLGSSDGRKTTAFFDDSPASIKSSWSATQGNADLFRKRWIADYLPTLTRRSKWFHPAPRIKVDDVVVIVDGNLPRNSWPMGRVLSVICARDGQVRRATVQTVNGILERPATKIAVLDVGEKVKSSDEASKEQQGRPHGINDSSGEQSEQKQTS